MTQRVSILVLNYNSLADTRVCLDSLAHDGFPDKEVLVLDNGSSANEKEIIEREFPVVRVLRGDTNLGYAGGNNFLAREACEDITIFLNNDTEVTPGWLPPLLAVFHDPDTAGCQPKILSMHRRTFFDYSGGCGGYLDALGFPYVRGRIFDTAEEDHGQYDDCRQIDWASGAALAVRRNVFLNAGGFDESFFAYMEEIDLCWRLRARGHRLLCVPSSVIFHKGGRILRRRLTYKRFLEHRNNLLTLAKNLSPIRAIVILPLRLALEWIACGYYIFSGQWKFAPSPARSFFSFFFHLPAVIDKREGGRGCTPTPAVRSIIFQYFFLGRRTWDSLQNVRRRSAALRAISV